MKKLLTICSICITASMLFSSCGSNFSIMKRHYTSGYYIDYTSNNKALTPKTEDRIAQPATETQANAVSADKQSNLQANSISANNEKGPALLANDKKVLAKTNLHITTRNTQANKPGVEESPFWVNNKAVSESPAALSSISDHDNGERAALSLLWLVIVIILILWLIGILAGGFGLGGLINLLLLIALILFILWLLRVW